MHKDHPGSTRYSSLRGRAILCSGPGVHREPVARNWLLSAMASASLTVPLVSRIPPQRWQACTKHSGPPQPRTWCYCLIANRERMLSSSDQIPTSASDYRVMNKMAGTGTHSTVYRLHPQQCLGARYLLHQDLAITCRSADGCLAPGNQLAATVCSRTALERNQGCCESKDVASYWPM